MPSHRTTPRHVVLLCHPKRESFNASVADRYCEAVRAAGHEAVLRDLYAMHFDPVLRAAELGGAHRTPGQDVREELGIIGEADIFVMVYPIWLGTPPAMLKGYVERVLGWHADAATLQTGRAQGVLAGKRLVSFTSSATNEVWLSLQGQPRSLDTIFDRYLSHAFGMQPPEHHHFGMIAPGIDDLTIRRHLSEVDMRARAVVRDVEAAIAATMAPRER